MRRFIAAFFAASCMGSVASADMARHAENVLIHTALHELAHAVFSELGVPRLGSEELLADDFATIMTVELFPDRATQIVADKAHYHREKGKTKRPKSDFSPRVDNERRAGRALCLLHGLMPDQSKALVSSAGMNEAEAKRCRHDAPEIAQGWRQALAPVMLPAGAQSENFALTIAEGPWQDLLQGSDLPGTITQVYKRFDWPAPVTFAFLSECNFSAGWSPKRKTAAFCIFKHTRLNSFDWSEQMSP